MTDTNDCVDSTPSLSGKLSALATKVERNESDINNLITTVTATREAVQGLSHELQATADTVGTTYKTLYGNGIDISHGVVSAINRSADELDRIHESIVEIRSDLSNLSNSVNANTRNSQALTKSVEEHHEREVAKEVAREATSQIDNRKKEVKTGRIKFGQFELTGDMANSFMGLSIPILIIAILIVVTYYIFAIIGKVPWPW